jgi:hypothetical protein
LVGTSTAAVSNSYWNSQTSLQTNSIGTGTQQGVALTTAQMTQQTSFPGLVFGAPGSDPLTNPWTMLPGASSPMSRALTGSITVTANSVNQQYSKLAYAGGNGVNIVGATSATVLSATTYTGASQGAINVGQYAITPFLTSSNPQFVVVYVNGTLALTAAPLVITVNSSTKAFGAANPVFSGVVTGFVVGDTLANSTSGVVTYASVATVASNVGNYAITASGLTANNGNYSISDIDGTLVTTRAALNITANSSTKVFGQTVAFNGSEFSSTGLQNGNSVGAVSLTSEGAPAVATVLGSPYPIIASAATGGTFTASNYFITYSNGTMVVTAAPTPVPPVVPTGGGSAGDARSPSDQSGSGGEVSSMPLAPPSPLFVTQTTTPNSAAKFLARCSTVIDPSVTKSIPDCWGSPYGSNQ